MCRDMYLIYSDRNCGVLNSHSLVNLMNQDYQLVSQVQQNVSCVFLYLTVCYSILKISFISDMLQLTEVCVYYLLAENIGKKIQSLSFFLSVFFFNNLSNNWVYILANVIITIICIFNKYIFLFNSCISYMHFYYNYKSLYKNKRSLMYVFI